MDGERFDALLRNAFGDASRRGVLRAGLGAVAAAAFGLVGLSGFDEAAARKSRAQKQRARKQRARKQKKKKGKRGPPGPPGPPGQPQTCANGQPFNCGIGCCNEPLPLCCPDPFETSGFSCNRAGRVCCPISTGGLSCPAGTECCPPLLGDLFGDCADNVNDKCCPPNSGGICATVEDCCPTAFVNDDNLGCCDAGVDCCNVDGDCGDPLLFDCVGGCCEPAP